MSQGANVDDLDVFRFTKASLIKFSQGAEAALLSADGQIARTLAWLEGEQMAYWQTQIRKRMEMVSRAKEAVRQKQIFKDSTGRTPSTAHEEKALKAAVQSLHEAEAKLDATKKAIPRLQKEIEKYRGGVQGLGGVLVTDIPRAIAMLEKAAVTLEDYMAMAASTAAPGDTASPTAPEESSMARGGETAEQPPQEPPSQPEPKPESPAAEVKEADNVAG
jgi:hypothetical protein